MAYRDEPDAPDWTETPLKKKPQLLELVLSRQDAAEAAAKAEEKKKECSAKILSILSSSNVERVTVDDYLVSIVTANRKSLDEGALKQGLVEAGVPIRTIEKLWETCTKTSSSSYVKVTGLVGTDE